MKKVLISAMNMGLLLKHLGLDQAEEFKALTEGEADSELTQEQFNKLMSSALSIEGAKAHPEVKKAFKGVILSPVDEAIVAALKAEGLNDNDIKVLLEGKETKDKAVAALSKLKELTKKDTSKTATERETEWQTKQADFELKLTQAATELQNERQARESDKLDYSLSSFLAPGDDFRYREDIPVNTYMPFAKQQILQAAQAKGARLVVGPDGRPMLADKDDATKPFHEVGSTTPLQLKDLTRGVLDSLKMLNTQPGKTEQEPYVPTGGTQQSQLSRSVTSSAAANDAFIKASMGKFTPDLSE